MNTDEPTGLATLEHALKRLPRVVRGHVVAVIGEFIGTLSFIFFAFAGTQTANVASNNNTGTTVITTTVQKNPAQLLYISLAFGFSLAVNAWVFFRISGGLFNPAVTLGMVLIGAITIVRGILLFIAQMAGAIVGAYLVQALFTGGLNVSTTLSATTTIAQGVIIEMLLTCLLVFTIFMLAAEKHTGNFIAPVGIGLALFISELVGVFWTGGSLNPARSFAPAVAIQSFHETQWVYWVGPIAGAILAVIIFKIIKALEYETANPDPESAAPTGPAPADYLNNVDSRGSERMESRVSRHTNDQDLESGYYDSSKEEHVVAAPPPMPAHVNNITMARPVQEGSRMDKKRQTAQRTESAISQRSGIALQNIPVRQLPPQRMNTDRMVPQRINTDDAEWNRVHTANARANTVVQNA